MSELAGRIAEAIRKSRRRKDMTQEELAEKIGLQPESVSNIERGSVVPTLETFAKLVPVLGLDVAKLFDGKPAERKVSAKRQRLEDDVRDIVESLDDDRVRDVIILARAFRDEK
jgi:transcriptional regulator with XRE-family HTH domain